MDEPFREVTRPFFIADENYRATSERRRPGMFASRISHRLVMRAAIEAEAQPAAGANTDG